MRITIGNVFINVNEDAIKANKNKETFVKDTMKALENVKTNKKVLEHKLGETYDLIKGVEAKEPKSSKT